MKFACSQLRRWQDHLSLYRLAQIYARDGLVLARSMMCGWHERLADLAEQLERVCRHHLSCHNVVATFSSINMIMWPLSMKAACAMRIGR